MTAATAAGFLGSMGGRYSGAYWANRVPEDFPIGKVSTVPGRTKQPASYLTPGKRWIRLDEPGEILEIDRIPTPWDPGIDGPRRPDGEHELLDVRIDPGNQVARLRLDLALPEGKAPEAGSFNDLFFGFENFENVAEVEQAQLVNSQGQTVSMGVYGIPPPPLRSPGWSAVYLVNSSFVQWEAFGTIQELELVLIPEDPSLPMTLRIDPKAIRQTFGYAASQYRRSLWEKTGMWVGGTVSLLLGGWIGYLWTDKATQRAHAPGSEAGLEEILKDPTYRDRLSQGEIVLVPQRGQTLLILQVSEQNLPPRIYLQAGLEIPPDLPKEIEVTPLGAGLEEVVKTWGENPPRPTDLVIFNRELTPEGPMLEVWLPIVLPPPAVLRVDPKAWAYWTAAYLGLLAEAARRQGWVLQVRSITFERIGSTVYAVIRSA